MVNEQQVKQFEIVAWVKGGFRQLGRDVKDSIQSFARNRSALIVANLVLAPWFVVIVIGHNTNPWSSFAMIFGIMFVYWFFTRGRANETVPVRQPIIEAALALSIVLLWMLYRIGEYVDLYKLPHMGLGSLKDIFDTIVPKFLEMFVLPLVVWLLLRYRPRDLGLRGRWRDWIPALIPIAALIFFGLRNNTPRQWSDDTFFFFLGAGLPEEFLFRGILQPRLESLLKSPVWGLYLASLMFGMSHLPINLSNTTPQNWNVAFESAFTFQLSVGFALGYAFQRVRNIVPLMVIHTLIDSAP
ncbi:MAG TPA: CPBP family intramembrane glutamic endopeptidase [Anaerolineae bacterium]|nr:CPBP family intramembrane glutamic endopeptidase [Anaerolineae bacterium]